MFHIPTPQTAVTLIIPNHRDMDMRWGFSTFVLVVRLMVRQTVKHGVSSNALWLVAVSDNTILSERICVLYMPDMPASTIQFILHLGPLILPDY